MTASNAVPMPARRALTFDELRRDWTRLVGAQIAAVTWPLLIVDGVELVVSTASPTWTQELELITPALLANLPPIDGHAVTSIVWRYAAPTRRARAYVHHYQRRGQRS
jgi:Dna[CI] antecedent DciA-like protein